MDAAALAELWYDVVEDADLWQGDIIRDLLAYALPQDLPVLDTAPAPEAVLSVNAGWDVGDWIVMSASCDLDRALDRYPFVLVCRVWPASGERLKVKPGKLPLAREVMRKGYDPLRFLLAEHSAEPHLELSFAEYRPHLTLPRSYLQRACVGKRRLRLKPPYREWFGNWVGANFSRVGINDEAQIAKFIEEGEPSASARIEASHRDVAPFVTLPTVVQPSRMTTAGGADTISTWVGRAHNAARAVKKFLSGKRD